MMGSERTEEGAAQERAAPTGSRWFTALLTATGLLCLGLAAAGLFLPVLPTTPFVLLAAACFARSSPRFYARLLASPTFGPVIREWRESRAISLRVKLLATSLIVLAGGLSVAFAVPLVWARVVLTTVLLAVIGWIWTFPHAALPPDSGDRG